MHFTVGEPVKAEKDAVKLREKVRAEIIRLYHTLPGGKPDYEVPHPDDIAAEAKRAAKEASRAAAAGAAPTADAKQA